jgi:hypothetical protein
MKTLLIALVLVLGFAGLSYSQDKYPNKSNWTISDGGVGGTLTNMTKLADVCRVIITENPKPTDPDDPDSKLTNKAWCEKQFRKFILRNFNRIAQKHDVDTKAAYEAEKDNIRQELDID